METRPLVRADLITGAVFAALGIAVLVESWNMPRLEERSINPWTVPGLVPGLLGVIIAMLGVILAVRSVLAGGMRPVRCSHSCGSPSGRSVTPSRWSMCSTSLQWWTLCQAITWRMVAP